MLTISQKRFFVSLDELALFIEPDIKYAIIDYFISGSINKASSSNETKKRFGLIVSIS